MLIGDGIGPIGMGYGTGKGLDRRRDRHIIDSRGLGPGGRCVCPVCGTTVPYQRREPCSMTTCPKCGARMTRR